MEMILAILIGIGLSASAGFRVFTPLLITSIASKASWVSLAEGFDWIGTTPALISFAIAMVVEICAYYIPFVDNFVKMIASPAAIIAGILLTASFVGDMDPFLTWSISIIAGGGIASVTQMATAAVRGTSTVTTGGMGNFIITIFEGISSAFIAILTILLPFFSIIFVAIILFIFIKIVKKMKARSNYRKSTQAN